jgi:hypothetical protein
LEDRVRRLVLRLLLERLDAVLRWARLPELRRLALEEREPRAADEEPLLLDPDEEPPPFTPDAAPRTMPRAAPNTTSPAFIAPASPYTAPCRMRPRARGDTAAAVAATAIPISLSIMSSRATFPPGPFVKIVLLRYPGPW